jgi:hypothetical protein
LYATAQAYIKFIHKKIIGYSGVHWRKLSTIFAFPVLLTAKRSKPLMFVASREQERGEAEWEWFFSKRQQNPLTAEEGRFCLVLPEALPEV